MIDVHSHAAIWVCHTQIQSESYRLKGLGVALSHSSFQFRVQGIEELIGRFPFLVLADQTG
jgi:hypothetical protein